MKATSNLMLKLHNFEIMIIQQLGSKSFSDAGPDPRQTFDKALILNLSDQRLVLLNERCACPFPCASLGMDAPDVAR
jgi:hypothetical protein